MLEDRPVKGSARFSAAKAGASLACGLLLAACQTIETADNRDTERGSDLRATMLTSPDITARPTFSLEVCNRGKTMAAIPTPMFPNHWRVIRHEIDGDASKSAECFGGAGSGVPDPGFPNRYDLSLYRFLKPGECYTTIEDLVFYLTICSTAVVPGEYEVDLSYMYSPTSDEAMIPIVTGPLRANTLHVKIGANSKTVGQQASRGDRDTATP
jgi:hypothetical protein